jgi:hypothetical protein
LRAVDFLFAVERLAVDFLAAGRLAVDFLFAVERLAVDFLAAGRLAVDFLFAVERLAVDLRAVDFLAVVLRLAALALPAFLVPALRLAALALPAFLVPALRFAAAFLPAVLRVVAMFTSSRRCSGRHSFQASPLPFAHAPPHPIALVAPQGVVEALDPDGAVRADALRLAG